MEQKQNDQQATQPGGVGEQNPTLQKAGASVPDYGNVMGGASDENAAAGQQGKQQENEGRSGGDNDTVGNP